MASPNPPDPLPPPVSEPFCGPKPTHSQDNTPGTADEDGGQLQQNIHPFDFRQSPFRPFFTVIQDAHSSEYHHPTVHYIFSDDDTDLITEAALRALEAGQGTNALRGSSNAHLREVDEDEQSGAHTKTSSLPPPVPGVQEHYIVVDIHPSHIDAARNHLAESSNINTRDPSNSTEGLGPTSAASQPTNETLQPPYPFTISSAHSLSPSWQILNSRLCTARTFDSSTNSPTAASASANNRPSSPVGGLMLEIEGTSGVGFTSSLHRSQDHQHRLEEMMEQFEKRMEELRQIIAAGEVYLDGTGRYEESGGIEAGTGLEEGV
ncbi:uncharacterized protein BDCG_07452 [Blastomyces dermatitidis ER-3]|uniref:Anaphase promoting complex subunit 11 n=1 Tax=Ajellomyces dermatitidis (strain ER-3 / ATCC MYA-2586) TaxID=559297 RepID=A0ABP2F616_AJEDR|nr:uncharacterized protein BDCG_07452 [Blastomyces dermatitidis ER-3]EEQ92332.1 hypothetical protein BDCG_07452 [Blastomyces dermatitidis ER-3]